MVMNRALGGILYIIKKVTRLEAKKLKETSTIGICGKLDSEVENIQLDIHDLGQELRANEDRNIIIIMMTMIMHMCPYLSELCRTLLKTLRYTYKH